jgi:hypothetical protein
MKKYLLLVMLAMTISLNTNASIIQGDEDESYSLDELKSDKLKGFSLEGGYRKYSLASESSSNMVLGVNVFMDVAKNVPLSIGAYYNMGLSDHSISGIKDVKISSVYVPIHVGYRYQPNPMKIFAVSLSAGPYADFQMTSDAYYSSKTKLISLSDAEGYKKLGFGLSGKLKFYFNPFINLFVEGGFGLLDRVKGEKDSFWQVGYFYQF